MNNKAWFTVSEKIELFIGEELEGWEWDDYGVNGVGTDDANLIMDDIRTSTPISIFYAGDYEDDRKGGVGSIDSSNGNPIASEVWFENGYKTFIQWYERYGDPGSLVED